VTLREKDAGREIFSPGHAHQKYPLAKNISCKTTGEAASEFPDQCFVKGIGCIPFNPWTVTALCKKDTP
jgi:hypothetical protein